MNLYLVNIEIRCDNGEDMKKVRKEIDTLFPSPRISPLQCPELIAEGCLRWQIDDWAENSEKCEEKLRSRIDAIPDLPAFEIIRIEALLNPAGKAPLESRPDGLPCTQQQIVGKAPKYVL